MKNIIRKINLALAVLVFALLTCLVGLVGLALALLSSTIQYLHLRKPQDIPQHPYYVETP
jgi:hypothetical protein